MRQIRTSGSMSGDRNRDHEAERDTGAPRKRPVTATPRFYRHRASLRLYRTLEKK